MTSIERIGVFGGSFDPPHIGHLAVAQQLVEELDLDRLVLVPAARSPGKSEPVAPAAVRLRMTEEAVAGHAKLETSAVEVERGGDSFTIDTLDSLAEEHRGARLVLAIGADQWAEFGRWHRARDIAERAEIAVMARAGERPGDLDPGFEDGPPPPFTEVPVTRIDVSSTLIRRRVQEGRSVRALVPEAVFRIIEREKLYL